MKRCCSCNRVIPQTRLDLLPNTPHCVGCSTARAKTEMDVECGTAANEELVRSVTGVERNE